MSESQEEQFRRKLNAKENERRELDAAFSVASGDLARAQSRIAELETALAEARAEGRRQGLEWRPIKTAPRDGSWFLTFDINSPMSWGPYDFGAWDEQAQWYCETDTSEQTDATHWMPLPAPPSLATAPTETQKPETGESR